MRKHLSIVLAMRFEYWARRRWACLDHISNVRDNGLIDAGYCLDNGAAA